MHTWTFEESIGLGEMRLKVGKNFGSSIGAVEADITKFTVFLARPYGLEYEDFIHNASNDTSIIDLTLHSKDIYINKV